MRRSTASIALGVAAAAVAAAAWWASVAAAGPCSGVPLKYGLDCAPAGPPPSTPSFTAPIVSDACFIGAELPCEIGGT